MFDIEKLRAVEGQELKYKALCEALGESTKTGNAKMSQLNNLQMYCRLDTLDHPTRYIVREVYDGQLITEINGNNQYQEVFDAVMYQALLNADNQLLYLSNLELLSLFAEVNENFTYSLNRNIMMKLSDNPYKTVEMAQIVYRVLKQWTKRRIDLMEKRRIVITRKGFRLYSKTGHYIYKHNVPIDSELEQSCRKVWNDALNETIGLNWKGQWVPDDKWAAFKSAITKLVQERFNLIYFDMKPVTVFSPPAEDWLRDKLAEIYKQAPALESINAEACRKILSTTQLDSFTGQERKHFVNTNIVLNPEISFKELLSSPVQP